MNAEQSKRVVLLLTIITTILAASFISAWVLLLGLMKGIWW